MLKPLFAHAAAQTSLATLLAEGKFPHALLLHGPRGIGKRLLAETLAWRLICGPAESGESDMFGTAPTQQNGLAYNADSPQSHQLAAGACPDFHLLAPDDGKKSIGVKQVQGILEVLRRTADTARVCLIDSIDDLTEEAANMLLKSLEEPRPGIYFLLVSHQLSRVLPTIRSRCRLLRLGPLPEAETRTVLHTHGADLSLLPLAAGCPGTVLAEGAEKRLKLLDQLAKWHRGEGAAPALNAEGLIPALSRLLAEKPNPTLADAEAYSRLQQLAARQAELNLPAALTHEAALALVKS